MKNFSFILWGLLTTFLTATCVSSTQVIEADDETLPALLAKGIPTVIDIYATWCGHCKKLAPELDTVSDYFAYAKDQVQFIKIDGDNNREVAKLFNLEYFPLIKFISGEEAAAGETGEELPARDAEGIADYVYEKTGIMPKKPKAPESSVVALTDSTFSDLIKGKSALVSFTASWCGHCKNMKPDYEQLAQIHKRDIDSLVIGNVDCTGEGTSVLCESYGVKSYPTLLFFDKDRKNDADYEQYKQARDVPNFLGYLNGKKVSYRTPDGSISGSKGRIPAFDEVLQEKGVSGLTEDLISEVAKELDAAEAAYVEVYRRYANKASASEEYIEKEISRLSKLLAGAKVAPEKVDQLQVKLNILNVFGQKPVEIAEAVQDEFEQDVFEEKEEL